MRCFNIFLRWFSISGVILFLIFIILEASTGEFKIKDLSNANGRGSFKYERTFIPRGYIYIKVNGVDINFYNKNKSKFTSCDRFIFLNLDREDDNFFPCDVEINKNNGIEILFLITLSEEMNKNGKDIYVTYDIDELTGQYKHAAIFTSTNFKILPDWLVLTILILCVLFVLSLSCFIISPIRYFFRDR